MISVPPPPSSWEESFLNMRISLCRHFDLLWSCLCDVLENGPHEPCGFFRSPGGGRRVDALSQPATGLPALPGVHITA